MAEALTYLLTLTLFSFVIVASACMKHDMLVLACFPPVFVAMIMGFTMAIYATNAFGMPPTGVAIAAAVLPGWWLARRLRPRDLLIAIYLAWSVSLVLAFVALGFPDRP